MWIGFVVMLDYRRCNGHRRRITKSVNAIASGVPCITGSLLADTMNTMASWDKFLDLPRPAGCA